MRKLFFIMVLVLNGVIIFYACKKDKVIDTPTDFDTQTSQDNSLAESVYNDVNNIANEAVQNGNSGLSTYRFSKSQNTLLSTCAIVTVHPDSAGNGGSIIVDFGTTNCQCTDTRFRRGIINIVYTGPYRDSGTVITTSFNNYFVGRDSANMFQVTGVKTVTNMGQNSSGHLNFDIHVDGHLINNQGATMDWLSDRNREWIAGESTTINWLDDEYVITGNATGTNFEGNSYTVVITSGLHVKLSCAYITQGTFDLTPAGKATRTLDYGNGTCDNQITVSVNNRSFTLYLR